MKTHTSLTSFLLLLLTSCAPVSGPDKSLAGGVLGAGIGSGVGAVIANQVSSTPGPGIAIGAGMLAASGIIAGAGLDLEEGAQLETRRRLSSAQSLTRYNRARLEDLHRQDAYHTRSILQPAFAQVFFDQGRASLKQASVAQLSHLASALRKRSLGTYALVLRGYSTDSKKESLNKELINARLESVKTVLLAHGLSKNSLVLEKRELKKEENYHSGILLSDDSEPLARYNNRVEIFVSYL